MWVVMVRNIGMWGMTVPCKKDGKVEMYATEEEAQKVADKRNTPCVNNFNHYFVCEEKNI